MFSTHIIDAIKEKTGLEDVRLETPPDSSLGDYAFPCFPLAKERKMAPPKIAEDLAGELSGIEGVAEIKATGPYVNFFLEPGALATAVIPSVIGEGDSYGTKEKSGQRVVIEYSAPNTNKPQHLGHVRNNLLGMAAATMLGSQGHDVVKVNWINDRGIHICKSMIAYQKFGEGKEPDKKPDHFVGEFYVEYARHEEELEEGARELLRKWEAGDEETLTLWKRMNDWAYAGFKETYGRLGCGFDKWFYESEIFRDAKGLVEEGLKKGVFEKNEEGAVVAKLEDHGLPDKVIVRADGTSIYVTADLALGLEKAKLEFSRSIYVIGSEQNLYIQQLFKIFELMGYPWASGLHHLSYGMVYLPEGKMKSREGKVVDADDLMDDVVGLARKEVDSRYPDLEKEEAAERAEWIGLGALKFYMLKTDPSNDMHYDPKESLSFEGETGPYVQYTYARAASVLRKAGDVKPVMAFSHLIEPEEKDLLMMLQGYPTAVSEAAESYKPHALAHFLLRMCQKFNEYYHKHQVIKAEEGTKEERVVLLAAVCQVLANGLGLLGIHAPERM
ncbi:MAG: arginine--tRNA ligase [archaeon]